jgi:uncharacterized protein (DUF362 family)/Pyruvate/2-oxoacid:ferredoxin oxidoreductase delta subunit
MNLKSYSFHNENILAAECNNTREIKIAVDEILEQKTGMLPASKDDLIFLKPNLNNDQNALMGNSTDIRVLVAVIFALQKRGYENITIGDGCNVGINRKGIDVFSRLKIDRVARKFGVQTIDLNNTQSREITLNGGAKAKVAEICFKAALFINLPKIKTHAEAQLTICLKNMVGTLAGGLEKKKMHFDLHANIIRLNEQIKPDLHIVDGLIAMEGNGPGDGHPRKVGLILGGEDPYLVDSFCARLMGFDIKELPSLKIGMKKGLIHKNDLKILSMRNALLNLEKPPPKKFLTRFLGHNIFMGLRDIVRPTFDNSIVTRLLYRLGIIQDVYIQDKSQIDKIILQKDRCTNCGICRDYCPMELNITAPEFDFSRHDGCIACLYCFCVCPENAVELKGELGYLSFYLEKHAERMRHL